MGFRYFFLWQGHKKCKEKSKKSYFLQAFSSLAIRAAFHFPMHFQNGLKYDLHVSKAWGKILKTPDK